MFSFSDLDSDIQTRIPDRPSRQVPQAISQMPEVPWLASKYEPKPSEKPSLKTVVSRVVGTGIPLLGTFAVLAIVGFGLIALFSLY